MAGSREGERLMLFSVEYQCGCKEDGIGALPRKCPMHGDPPVRSFSASRQALALTYGEGAFWQPAFYPRIEGANGLATA